MGIALAPALSDLLMTAKYDVLVRHSRFDGCEGSTCDIYGDHAYRPLLYLDIRRRRNRLQNLCARPTRHRLNDSSQEQPLRRHLRSSIGFSQPADILWKLRVRSDVPLMPGL